MACAHSFNVGSRLGFIGVGTINSAVIEGIFKIPTSSNSIIDHHFSLPIFVSPRGKVKVDGLLKKHGVKKIHICQSNQEVLDNADVIFIGVRPEQVVPMLQNDAHNDEVVNKTNDYNIKFDIKRHCIVNLVSTLTNAQLIDMINCNQPADATVCPNKIMGRNQVVKAVPLPGVQFLSGTTALTPPKLLEGKIFNLFKQLGTAIEVEEDHLPYFQAITCMMGPFYQHCQFLQEWIHNKIRKDTEEHSRHSATKNDTKAHDEELHNYLTGFFDTLLSDARHGGEPWAQLMSAQTKGGLNEQAMHLMAETKEVTHSTLDTILNRLQTAKNK